MSQSRINPTLGLIAALMISLAPVKAGALTIAPAYVDRTLNPGDTIIESLQVLNDQDAPVAFFPTVLNFTAGNDEQGTPQFYAADEDPYGTALAQWVSVSADKVELAAQQRTSLLFTINIPTNARPGSYFGAVALSSSPSSPGASGVGVHYKVAELIMVKVAGDVRNKGAVTEFGFEKPQLWYEHLPVEFFFRYENSGNTHLRPTGEMVITDCIGRRAATVKVNEEFKSVLPLSIRRFRAKWGDEVSDGENSDGFWSGLRREYGHFALGKYKVALYLDNGTEGMVLAAEREVSVWPWRLMSVSGAAAALVLIIVIWSVIRYARSVPERRKRKS
jgi:hypothetical protein